MKYLSIAIVILAGALLVSAAPKSEDEFLKEFRSAITSKDSQKVMALYCLDDALDAVKASLPQQIEPLVKRKIKTIELVEMPADKKAKIETGRPFQGKRLVNNIPIVKELKITFEDDGTSAITKMTLPVGKKGAEYFVATSKLVD